MTPEQKSKCFEYLSAKVVLDGSSVPPIAQYLLYVLDNLSEFNNIDTIEDFLVQKASDDKNNQIQQLKDTLTSLGNPVEDKK